jgi:hypothetical protein
MLVTDRSLSCQAGIRWEPWEGQSARGARYRERITADQPGPSGSGVRGFCEVPVSLRMPLDSAAAPALVGEFCPISPVWLGR